MNRDTARAAFLKSQNIGPSKIAFLAGDASNRKYFRVDAAAKANCLLMDAPPEKGEDIQPFIKIAGHLKSNGISAPEIFSANTDTGFALIEDFGDDLLFDLVETNHALELDLYHKALDVLDHLHQSEKPSGLTPYGIEEMSDAAALVADWYAENTDRKVIQVAVHDALSTLDWSNPVLILRDYHAQNLIVRDVNSNDITALGVLDFQDAQIGHRLYDAMSLIDDARRDVTPETRNALLHRITKGSRSILTDCNILSAQRNLRILGVFARLCIRDGKSSYIDLIPRVWRNLQRNLSDDGLGALAMACAQFPEPTENHLNRLRAKCATL